MSDIEQREASLPLGVVVERRKSSHRWANWIWRPVSVHLEGATRRAPWTPMLETDEVTRWHAATLDLVLHRADTEALTLNLMLERPEIYVVLQESTGPFPWVPQKVSASSYEAQDWEDPADRIVEKVEMPQAVAAFVQAFVEIHHVEKPFLKRRRSGRMSQSEQFGKTPIFVPVTKR